ncbi:MAG: glutamine synthetase family protein, partial [Nanoarchaeota archaeon]|nr:glutamine synthetase family protein [Nanoarchaeota archaeon]
MAGEQDRFNPKTVKRFQGPDDVLRELQDNPNIRFVRLFFSDLIGNIQCDFTVPSYALTEPVFKEGIGYDGGSILGQARIQESDKKAVPIPETAVVTPWSYQTESFSFPDRGYQEMIMFANIVNPDGSRYEGDVRNVLETTIQKAGVVGADTFYIGPELEFFLFKADKQGAPILEKGLPVLMDAGGYFKGGKQGRVRKEAQLVMQSMGYEFTTDHHEVAPSQHEITFMHLDAMRMADATMLYKYVLRKVAEHHEVFASFMPKPMITYHGKPVNGSGMHLNQSLFKKDKNIFADPNTPDNLSRVAKQYLAGLLTHVNEITAVLNPTVNSYKRLVPGCEAPVYVCWDPTNRSNLIRIPATDKEKAVRLELRSPDPTANPYLAYAVMLAAGLKGIEGKYTPPDKVPENVYEMTPEERAKRGIGTLPQTLEEALDAMEQGTIVRETLGDHLYN